MKTIILKQSQILCLSFSICLLFSNLLLLGQKLQWAMNIGGNTGYDRGNGICQTADGGFAVICSSSSTDGIFSQSYGNSDSWVLKFDNMDMIQWTKNFGGSGLDAGNSILSTPDSGFIIAGTSNSNDKDFINNKGGSDFFVIKISKNGAKEWVKNYGGTDFDDLKEIHKTYDGGYILIGSTSSNNVDFSSNKGQSDIALIKINSNGIKQWAKTYGGSGVDYGLSGYATRDSGFIVTGFSDSKDGDFLNNKGFYDICVIKTDKNGNTEWGKNYGGSKDDQGYTIRQTGDGGYIIGGSVRSNNGDFSKNYGASNDMGVIKIDSVGTKQWSNNFGGYGVDNCWSIRQTDDGGYIIGGGTNSTNLDFNQNKGGGDIGVIKINKDGMKQWSQNYGGSLDDGCISIELSSDGSIIIAGSSASNDGDFNQNFGGINDIAILKICGNLIPVISGNHSYCKGGKTELSINGTYNEIKWSNGNNNPSILVASPGIISVTVTDSNGCTGINSVMITENLNPEPIINGNLIFCEGGFVTLGTALDYDSYNWSNGSTDPIVNINSSGKFSVTVTDLNLCSGIDTVEIIENEKPKPSIVGVASFCKGDSTILSTSETYSTYFWSNGNTSQSNIIKSEGIFIITVTDQNLCIGTDTIEVLEHNKPAPIIVGSLSFCIGDSTSLSTEISYNNYLWSGGNTSASATFYDPDSIAVFVTDNNGCTGGTFVKLTNFDPIDTSILQIEDKLVAQADDVLYQWLDCSNNSPIAQANNKEFYPITSGFYAVALTDNNLCMDTSACISITKVAVYDETINSNFNLYPNPTQDIIYVKLHFPGRATMQLKLLDNLGRELSTQRVNLNEKEESIVPINTEEYQSGLYHIQIVADGLKQVKTFSIIK